MQDKSPTPGSQDEGPSVYGDLLSVLRPQPAPTEEEYEEGATILSPTKH